MIGGLHRCSFIDFPGRLSAVVFLRGCNLQCPYCHNAELIPKGSGRAGAEELLEFLASRRGRLDGVVFTGGEPTLRPELPMLIMGARSLGYEIKLDTNGTRPEVLSVLIDGGTLEYIALDFKDEPWQYQGWLGSCSDPEAIGLSLDLVKRSGVEHELRTTVIWPHHDPERLDRMAAWAAGCARWVLQPFRASGRLSRVTPFKDTPAEYLEEQAHRIRRIHGVDCRTRGKSGGWIPMPVRPGCESPARGDRLLAAEVALV